MNIKNIHTLNALFVSAYKLVGLTLGIGEMLVRRALRQCQHLEGSAGVVCRCSHPFRGAGRWEVRRTL